MIKRKVRLGEDGLARECARCDGPEDELCIDNVEGIECLSCGCWFDYMDDGTVIWARQSRPLELE